ncbi:MAG: hypothetical protein EPN37_10280 [Chitinophagaceae bacterium]|nr:MAG: hypothetical protein EPN37_10280 [Chitinophagaceae bacterium]
MQSITDRFLKAYEYLLSEKIISSGLEFSNKIEISSSLLTEIKKHRSQVGLTAIQNTVKFFPHINPNWLLTGEGDMIPKNNEKTAPNTAPNTAPIVKKSEHYVKYDSGNSGVVNAEKCAQCEEKERVIKAKEEVIASLHREVQKAEELVQEKERYIKALEHAKTTSTGHSTTKQHRKAG